MDPQQAPLVRADLDAVVAAIGAQITDAVGALQTRFDAVEKKIDAVEQSLEQKITARIEAAEHATATNLSDVRAELIERLERVERRTERIEINVNALLAVMAGVSKSLTVGEQFDSATAGTLAGIKRTIDELARRIDGLEKAS